MKLLIDNPTLFLKAIDVTSSKFQYLDLENPHFKDAFKKKIIATYQTLKEVKNEAES